MQYSSLVIYETVTFHTQKYFNRNFIAYSCKIPTHETSIESLPITANVNVLCNFSFTKNLVVNVKVTVTFAINVLVWILFDCCLYLIVAALLLSWEQTCQYHTLSDQFQDVTEQIQFTRANALHIFNWESNEAYNTNVFIFNEWFKLFNIKQKAPRNWWLQKSNNNLANHIACIIMCYNHYS